MAKRRREPETATINSATHDGRGIAAVSGKKVFVSGALPGETVQFIRRKSRRNYDEAEMLDVIQPSASFGHLRSATRARLRDRCTEHLAHIPAF